MKTTVKLNSETTNTIHVDEVDVFKGVVVKSKHNSIGVLVKSGGKINVWWTTNENGSWFNTLEDMITSYNGCQFFTLDGKQITTEKVLTVSDLKNSDHIGFIESGRKGYISYVGNKNYMPLAMDEEIYPNCNDAWSELVRKDISKVIPEHVKEIFKFTTRKELYQWLAE